MPKGGVEMSTKYLQKVFSSISIIIVGTKADQIGTV
jgi:hypothetical protein